MSVIKSPWLNKFRHPYNYRKTQYYPLLSLKTTAIYCSTSCIRPNLWLDTYCFENDRDHAGLRDCTCRWTTIFRMPDSRINKSPSRLRNRQPKNFCKSWNVDIIAHVSELNRWRGNKQLHFLPTDGCTYIQLLTSTTIDAETSTYPDGPDFLKLD